MNDCRKTGDRHSKEAFFRCAAVILPYLNPTELASISSTCKTLYEISKPITARRASDASRGFENLPIPFLKPTAAAVSHAYSYFIYTPTQTFRLRDDFRQPWGSDDDARLEARPDPFLFRVEGATGCNCPSGCGECCPCSKADESLLNRECGPSCRCDSGCGNRVTEGGVTVRLKIVKDERKGWCLHAAELITTGQFVCEYAGNFRCLKLLRQNRIFTGAISREGASSIGQHMHEDQHRRHENRKRGSIHQPLLRWWKSRHGGSEKLRFSAATCLLICFERYSRKRRARF